ncbi:MAG: TetR family transcriptional regulator [Rhodobacterales bacterium]|nr:MAG: TetR family transcriptional regulator [Rhodobacterales bacterium]
MRKRHTAAQNHRKQAKNDSTAPHLPKVTQAALRLFARYGYAAVSMRQIAAEVGLQAGALYLYTPDKQTLLFDLMRDHMQALLAAWQDCEKGEDALSQLEAFVRFHIDFHQKRLEAVFISYMELRNLTEENFCEIEGLRKQYEDVLEGILRRGQAEGVFQVPDTKLAMMAVIAMLTGVNTWYREGGRLSWEKVGDIYWNMVKKAVLA